MKIINKESGFGDFSFFVFIGIFAVIGSLFIIRIFAASRPTISIQLSGYRYTNGAGQIQYSGVRGFITTHDASSCSQTGGDSNWSSVTLKNGENWYDSHPLMTASKYTYTVSCKNSAGTITATQIITVP